MNMPWCQGSHFPGRHDEVRLGKRCRLAISAAGQLTRLFALQGLRIDESTAMYYLKESGGDLKKAVRLFEADKTWDGRP